MSVPAETPRNAPCPCGSGKRYKHCHGAGGPPLAAPASAPTADALMRRALEAQQSRRADEAERAYRDVLALRPDEPDALHMLGVLRHERGDDDEAVALTMRALELTGWRIPFMRKNLGIFLAARGGDEEEREADAMERRYAAMLAARRAAKRASTPRVSVVVPAYNHAAYVERAIASALAQTWRDVEIVVIDDGSSDATADLAARVLDGAARPHRLVRRANRGAPATLNEGAALASGDYLQFLNSDDWLEPTRVERMVDEVACVGAGWGYSSVSIVDERGGSVDPMTTRRAYDVMSALSAIPFRPTVGFSLLPFNTTVSTGNLFVSRAFFDRAGGFRDLRWNHDWDFALRAAWLDEPVFVDEPLYAYRLHAANTIAESADRARAEMAGATNDYLALALDEAARPPNPFAPAVSTWGPAFLNALLSGGIGGILDPALLRRVALAKLERTQRAAASTP